MINSLKVMKILDIQVERGFGLNIFISNQFIQYNTIFNHTNITIRTEARAYQVLLLKIGVLWEHWALNETNTVVLSTVNLVTPFLVFLFIIVPENDYV